MGLKKMFSVFRRKQPTPDEPEEPPEKPTESEKPLRGLLRKEAYVLEKLRKDMDLEKELPPMDDERPDQEKQ